MLFLGNSVFGRIGKKGSFRRLASLETRGCVGSKSMRIA
jgi:hypothetical protein